MKTLKFASLAVALTGSLFLLPQAAQATAVAVGNSSFEIDGTGINKYPQNGTPSATATSGSGTYYEQYDTSQTNDTTILGPDWSAQGSAVGWNLIDVNPSDTSAYNNRFLTAGTSLGPTYAFLNENNPATLTTTAAGLSLAIQANTIYTLTVAVGNPTPTGPADVDPVPNEFIQFLANGSALNSTLFPLATVNVSSAPNGTFTDYTATFTTGAVDTAGIFGDALALQMGGSYPSGIGVGAYDNVRLDVSAVPEPSTYALVAFGVGALVLANRARRLRA